MRGAVLRRWILLKLGAIPQSRRLKIVSQYQTSHSIAPLRVLDNARGTHTIKRRALAAEPLHKTPHAGGACFLVDYSADQRVIALSMARTKSTRSITPDRRRGTRGRGKSCRIYSSPPPSRAALPPHRARTRRVTRRVVVVRLSGWPPSSSTSKTSRRDWSG